jgi:hypothetical protein
MGIQKIAVGAAFALLLNAAPASAQFLSFVSATGNDTNSCFVQASPCKTLQRAINQTSAGGEIQLLSTLPAQLVTVAKSLTIDGGDNTMIGTITINSASAIVRLRRLSLTGRHAVATGINIINAAAVHIEECSVERYTNIGIRLAPGVSTELFILDSASRDNNDFGLRAFGLTSAKLTIDNSRFDNNGSGLAIESGGKASITRSSASSNAFSGFIIEGAANIADTIAAENGNGAGFAGFAVFGANLTLESSVAQGNDIGLFVASSPSVARVSNSVFTNNDTGVSNIFTGTFLTLGNNLIAGNTTNVDGTAPTVLPGE